MLVSPYHIKSRAYLRTRHQDQGAYRISDIFDGFVREAYRTMRKAGISANDARRLVLNLCVTHAIYEYK